MLLIDVAATSVQVAGATSRGAKIARIAGLLSRAAPDSELVAVVVAWLSGELPQRQIGVGWATLRSLPPAAAQPTLRVGAVDAALSSIKAVCGKGAQARRTDLVAGLFAAATETEQAFLR
ncbi:MAG: ATP-dependent DNA ligase, partial [Mycobacterium sp.]